MCSRTDIDAQADRDNSTVHDAPATTTTMGDELEVAIDPRPTATLALPTTNAECKRLLSCSKQETIDSPLKSRAQLSILLARGLIRRKSVLQPQPRKYVEHEECAPQITLAGLLLNRHRHAPNSGNFDAAQRDRIRDGDGR